MKPIYMMGVGYEVSEWTISSFDQRKLVEASSPGPIWIEMSERKHHHVKLTSYSQLFKHHRLPINALEMYHLYVL
jgi:hypothetical protein